MSEDSPQYKTEMDGVQSINVADPQDVARAAKEISERTGMPVDQVTEKLEKMADNSIHIARLAQSHFTRFLELSSELPVPLAMPITEMVKVSMYGLGMWFEDKSDRSIEKIEELLRFTVDHAVDDVMSKIKEAMEEKK